MVIHTTRVRRIDSFPSLTPRLVSGHAVQIKDLDGDEDDGLDECLFLLFLFGGIPVMSRILLGICAVDYSGDNRSPNPDTPGIIVDDVSYSEPYHVSLYQSVPWIFLDHAPNHGEASSVAMSLNCHFRCEPDPF